MPNASSLKYEKMTDDLLSQFPGPSQGEWLRIDLGTQKDISGIATQGEIGKEGTHVTNYTLSYSLDGSVWSNYSEEGKIKVVYLAERFTLNE